MARTPDGVERELNRWVIDYQNHHNWRINEEEANLVWISADRVCGKSVLSNISCGGIVQMNTARYAISSSKDDETQK